MTIRMQTLIGLALLSVMASGCAKAPTEAAATVETLSGAVVMGPISGAKVSVHVLNADGSRGSLLAETQTDPSGNYNFGQSYSGSVEVVATGGSYVDEATGTNITVGVGREIRSIVSSGSRVVALSALTTIAADKIQKTVGSLGVDAASKAAYDQVGGMFGLSGMDISAEMPVDVTKTGQNFASNPNRTKYGMISAAFTQIAKDKALPPAEVLKLLKNMAADYSDGKLDGLQAGAALPETLSVVLTPSAAMDALGTAVTNFANNPRNVTGMTAASFGFQFVASPR